MQTPDAAPPSVQNDVSPQMMQRGLPARNSLKHSIIGVNSAFLQLPGLFCSHLVANFVIFSIFLIYYHYYYWHVGFEWTWDSFIFVR